MESILEEIERALSAGFYHSALMIALSMPDVCASLEAENGRGGPNRYRAWYQRYLAEHYPFMNADDCYSLRNGVVHQANLNQPRTKDGKRAKRFDRIIFQVPTRGGLMMHNNIFSRSAPNTPSITVLQLNLQRFCQDVIGAVRRWLDDRRNDLQVQANMFDLVTFRPQGLPPWIVGVPLIA